jgi:hypothetical protein
MSLLHSLWFVAGLIFLVNLPFGFWRASARRFSGPWFVAIHAPVILAVGFRMLLGMRFLFATAPLFVGAFVLGQSVGGRLRGKPDQPDPSPEGETV